MNCEACGHENVEGARFCASCGALLPLEHTDENPMIGQLIGGRYRITAVLGEGGMGVVYVGEQQMGSTVRKVAVKTLHQHLSKDPSVLARFHRECGTVAQLEHPNTIKFYDFGATADGTLYIAMEFVAGKPLNQVIETSGPLSTDRTLKILRQICGALEEAHKQGIVHRDLKPENVILTDRAGETDFVKVLDFGIAARTESADAQKEQKLTQQGMVLGTPPYMSPEQFTGKALDKRSDIYSLGVLSYEMLSGRLPFEADTPWQWATQHMTAQPLPFEASAPSSSIPKGMATAIMRALSKNRDDRQDSARQFFAELAESNQFTGEQVPRPQGRTGTAAMGAAPQFSDGQAPEPAVVPTAQMSAPGRAGPQPQAVYAPAVPHGPGPLISPGPAPAIGRRPTAGGGTGLLIGLMLVGGILLIAIVVVAARSMKPEEEQSLSNPFTSASAVATIAPQLEVPDTPTAPSVTAVPDTHTPVTAQPTPKPKSKTQPKAEPTKPAVAGPSGAAACDACIAAAQSGNIQAASGNFARCDDAAKKQRCRGIASAKAPSAVRSAAFNGNCAQAKQIALAARAMGAGDLSGAMGSCQK